MPVGYCYGFSKCSKYKGQGWKVNYIYSVKN